MGYLLKIPKHFATKEIADFPLLPRITICELIILRVYQALRENNWNRTKAAYDCGICVRMMGYYVHKMVKVGMIESYRQKSKKEKDFVKKYTQY